MKQARLNPFARTGLAVCAAVVAGLHLQILWSRLADGSVLDPVVAGRWLASAAVVLIAVVGRRRGLSLFRGRPALVLWLLVVLLHGVGMVPAAEAAAPDTMPAGTLLIVTPLALGAATLFWARSALTRFSRRVPFALLPRRALRRETAVVFDGCPLVASGPRAPPR